MSAHRIWAGGCEGLTDIPSAIITDRLAAVGLRVFQAV
jgi:hypothetical protein